MSALGAVGSRGNMEEALEGGIDGVGRGGGYLRSPAKKPLYWRLGIGSGGLNRGDRTLVGLLCRRVTAPPADYKDEGTLQHSEAADAHQTPLNAQHPLFEYGPFRST